MGTRGTRYQVPFKSELLPGVTFVKACEAMAPCITRVGDSRILDPDDGVRHDAIRATLARIARGAAGNDHAIASYGQTDVAQAIQKAQALIAQHGKPAQADRYRNRVYWETDRLNGMGRAGTNPDGWADSPTRRPSRPV